MISRAANVRIFGPRLSDSNREKRYSRVKRESVRKLLDRMNIHVRASDANGITIDRCAITVNNCGEYRKVDSCSPGGHYNHQNWRLYCGSGIACNSGRWWLRYEERDPFGRLLGPFKTSRELETELRRWRRYDSP
jgi:hypothetical protein